MFQRVRGKLAIFERFPVIFPVISLDKVLISGVFLVFIEEIVRNGVICLVFFLQLRFDIEKLRRKMRNLLENLKEKPLFLGLFGFFYWLLTEALDLFRYYRAQ